MATKKDEATEEIQETGRGYWSRNLEAIFSYIGLSVGLGNIWRFPYLCYKNGGGAFLIPYTIMMVLIGIPLFFLELSIGQFSSLGPCSVWKLSPFFKGLGYTAALISAVVSIYYNMLIAYILYYLYSSLTSNLPWSDCDNEWNTVDCGRNLTNSSMTGNETYPNQTTLMVFPSEEYWKQRVLQTTERIDDTGSIQIELFICLTIAWVLAFLCLIKGIKSSGKVMYFTASFPYVMLFVLFVRGVTLPGSLDGLKYYIVPDFKKLAEPWVWGSAAAQIFYSLGPAWGSLITYSSFSKFHTNIHRDAVVCTLICCATSVFAGLVAFTIVGYMAHQMGVSVTEVILPGPGLVFVVYPEALSRLPVAPLWSFLFFFMLLCVSLDSQFAQIQTVTTSLQDELPKVFGQRKMLATALVCLVLFILGIPQCFQSGIYIVTLVDWAVGSYPLLVVGLLEVVVVNHVYGFRRFALDIKSMLGFVPNIYWKACWLLLTPLTITLLIIFIAATYQPVKLGVYIYPSWCQALGSFISALLLIWIPIWMIIRTIRVVKTREKSSNQDQKIGKYYWICVFIRTLLSPASDWGPALTQNQRKRELIDQYSELSATELDIATK